MREYIKEIHGGESIIFECNCGFKFKCGIINLEENTIFCPKCNTEYLVEAPLYEHECPSLDEYLSNK